MHVARVVVGPLRTNCYVLHDAAAGTALVVDPGDDAAAVLAALGRLGSPPVAAIVLTHCHWDHVQAVDAMRDACGAPVAARAEEHCVWAHELDHLRGHGHWDWALAADERPASNDPITPGWDGTIDVALDQHHDQFGLDVVHTPGHSPGSISLVARADRFVLTGDTLFPGGPGLTGWPLSDFPAIIDSVARLFALPDETVVLPGHGPSTTIGRERPCLEEWRARGW